MDLDQAYASALDALDSGQGSSYPIDWTHVRQLIGDALVVVDAGGRGHGAVGRALSTAYAATEAELGLVTRPLPDFVDSTFRQASGRALTK